MDEYQNALNVEPNGDRFYLISEAYNLGDEIYYVRFSTDPVHITTMHFCAEVIWLITVIRF